MGGRGSGSYWRWDSKTTTESQHGIDIRWLKKRGCLYPGTSGSLQWSRRGEQTGAIGYRMEADRMVLNYRHRPRDGDWEVVEQSIYFDRTPAHFGGTRKWFCCPGCGGRVTSLYGAGKYFYCRHCYNLTFASQQESAGLRYMRKAQNIRERLGADQDLDCPIWEKPKHMHWKTFQRLAEEEKKANRRYCLAIAQFLGYDPVEIERHGFR